MNKTYYAYEHIRNDSKEVFYVGIGTKNPNSKYMCKKYARAHIKSATRRSTFWYNVYIKCNKDITICIVFETNNLDEIKTKEKQLIAKYGQKILGTGSLVNLTKGGDGMWGNKWSDESRIKRSILYKDNNPFKGKKHTQETKDYLAEVNRQRYLEGKGIKPIKYTEEIRKKISEATKARWNRGELHKPPIMKGADNYFAKSYLIIDHNTGNHYEVKGNIKGFCLEHALSYSYVKKFKDKGRCYLEDIGRARQKARNTVNWEFKSINK